MKAERHRREAILTAEGEKASKILVAEGHKESQILNAEAENRRQFFTPKPLKKLKYVRRRAKPRLYSPSKRQMRRPLSL